MKDHNIWKVVPLGEQNLTERRERVASDILKGKWKQLKGSIQERWGELTDDDVDKVEGESQRLIGLLQEKYGYAKEKAEAEVAEFMEEHS